MFHSSFPKISFFSASFLLSPLISYLVKNASRKFYCGGGFGPVFQGSFVKSLVTPAWDYRKKWRAVGQHSRQAPRWNFLGTVKFCKKIAGKKGRSRFVLLFFYLSESILVRPRSLSAKLLPYSLRNWFTFSRSGNLRVLDWLR